MTVNEVEPPSWYNRHQPLPSFRISNPHPPQVNSLAQAHNLQNRSKITGPQYQRHKTISPTNPYLWKRITNARPSTASISRVREKGRLASCSGGSHSLKHFGTNAILLDFTDASCYWQTRGHSGYKESNPFHAVVADHVSKRSSLSHLTGEDEAYYWHAARGGKDSGSLKTDFL